MPAAEPANPASALSPISVRVGRIYDGPLDLLLELIRKQDIDIRDIPIARITSQYLAFLQDLRDLDVEVAAEFLLMAATLIQIKSRMLLPAAPALPGESLEDPREDLVRRLIEYEQFKKAAEMLHERQQLESASWPRPAGDEFAGDRAAEPELAVSTFDLTQAFEQVLRRLKERPVMALDAEEDITVGQALEHLKKLLLAGGRPLRVRELFEAAPNRRVLVTFFLAVLEMVRLQAVELRQERMFGDILIRKHRLFDTVFAAAAPEPGKGSAHE